MLNILIKNLYKLKIKPDNKSMYIIIHRIYNQKLIAFNIFAYFIPNPKMSCLEFEQYAHTHYVPDMYNIYFQKYVKVQKII